MASSDEYEYDVFLSHHSDDKDEVEAIARRLEEAGATPWLDKWRLVPGESWQPELERALERSRTVAVFFGASGFGGWHRQETQVALSASAVDGRRVIPVLLPGGNCEGLPSEFLRLRTWVDLTSGTRDLGTLLAGIRGVPPGSGTRDEARRLHTDRLTFLYDQIDSLKANGDDASALVEETLDLKRKIRSGPQLGAGDVLAGRYRLVRELGRGGFATVWEAFDRKIRTRVAVKLLHGEHTRDKSRVERFFRGARIMAKLDHPGIVRVLDPNGADDGHRFFVMEYVEGSDLRRLFKTGALDSERILDIMESAAEAMAECHAQGIVHRDLKPANILVTREGRTKVSDFDLVQVGDTTGGTRTGALGTVIYAAEECLKNASTADARADVYSLSMTTIVGLRGEEPTLSMIYSRALFEGLSLSDGLRAVLSAGVSIDREGRPVDAEAWLAAVRDAREASRARRSVGSGHAGEAIELDAWKKRAGESHLTAGAIRPARVSSDGSDPVATTETASRSGVPMGFAPSEIVRTTRGARVLRPARIDGPGERQDWAFAQGTDSFGHWADARIAGVDLRMRRIEPGSFLMGSPEDEEGREDDEGPQHEVTISEGFWLAEAPCTQALWKAVVGLNPSRYKGPTRPVEQVSWDDVQTFLARVSERGDAGFGWRLPTEAEWEYASRAGTTGARYGDLKAIAWHARYNGTKPVKRKAPNPWGLYDMLGNVWEWCADGALRGYPPDPRHDPYEEPAVRRSRVARGGSWASDAVFVRAARRGEIPRVDRIDSFGFRLARGRALPGTGGAA